MKFTVSGSSIVCSRRDNTVGGDGVYKGVVEFDAQVDSVPPHVAARLTDSEIEELRNFLAERKRIQADSVEKNLLEALPELLQEATEVLDAIDSVNKATYKDLSKSITRLAAALENVKPVSQRESAPAKKMGHSEAQKERLENIKQDL